MTQAIHHIFDGLALGAIYALLAAAHVLMRGALRRAWFWNGAIFILAAIVGTYAGRFFAEALEAPSPLLMHMLLVFVVCTVFSALVGGVVSRWVAAVIDRRPAVESLALQIAVLYVAWWFYAQVPAMNWRTAQMPQGYPDPLILLSGAIMMIGLWTLLHSTRLGMTIRAVMSSQTQAASIGIDVRRTTTVAAVTSGFFIGIAATGWLLKYPATGMNLPIVPVLVGMLASLAAGYGSIWRPAAIALVCGIISSGADGAHSPATAIVATLIFLSIIFAVTYTRGWRPHDRIS